MIPRVATLVSLTLLGALIVLSQSGCALAYFLHAKEDKMLRELRQQTHCQEIDVLDQQDERVRVRACGAIWDCQWQQDFTPTSPLSTEHGHWRCGYPSSLQR